FCCMLHVGVCPDPTWPQRKPNACSRSAVTYLGVLSSGREGVGSAGRHVYGRAETGHKRRHSGQKVLLLSKVCATWCNVNIAWFHGTQSHVLPSDPTDLPSARPDT